MAKIVPLELLYFCIKMNTALARGIWQIFYALGTSLLMAIITYNLSLKILNYHFKGVPVSPQLNDSWTKWTCTAL